MAVPFTRIGSKCLLGNRQKLFGPNFEICKHNPLNVKIFTVDSRSTIYYMVRGISNMFADSPRIAFGESANNYCRFPDKKGVFCRFPVHVADSQVPCSTWDY